MNLCQNAQEKRSGGPLVHTCPMENGPQFVQRVANYGHQQQNIQGASMQLYCINETTIKMVNTCNRNTFCENGG